VNGVCLPKNVKVKPACKKKNKRKVESRRSPVKSPISSEKEMGWWGAGRRNPGTEVGEEGLAGREGKNGV